MAGDELDFQPTPAEELDFKPSPTVDEATDVRNRVGLSPPVRGERNLVTTDLGPPSPKPPSPNKQNWDKRADGSAKGNGFLGVLNRPDNSVSSEISVSTDEFGGQEFPTLVPTLSADEVSHLLNSDISAGNIPRPILQKAAAFARERQAKGLPFFAQPGEEQNDLYPQFTRSGQGPSAADTELRKSMPAQSKIVSVPKSKAARANDAWAQYDKTYGEKEIDFHPVSNAPVSSGSRLPGIADVEAQDEYARTRIRALPQAGDPRYRSSEDMPGSFEGQPENTAGYVEEGPIKAASGAGRLVKGLIPSALTPEERYQAGTDTLTGAMNTALPLAAMTGVAAPVSTAVGLGTGVVAGKAAGKITEEMGGSPQAQEFAETAGFFLPNALAMASGLQSSVRTGIDTKGNPIGAKTIEAFGDRAPGGGRVPGTGRVAAGVAQTSEGINIAGKVGPYKAGVTIPFGGKGAAAAPAPALTEGQAQLGSTIQAMGDQQATQQYGAPVTETGPKELTPQVLQGVAEAIKSLPAEQQGAAIIEAHQNLAKWMLSKGSFINPTTGMMEIANNEKQAQTLAAKIINEQIEAHASKEPVAGGKAEGTSDNSGVAAKGDNVTYGGRSGQVQAVSSDGKRVEIKFENGARQWADRKKAEVALSGKDSGQTNTSEAAPIAANNKDTALSEKPKEVPNVVPGNTDTDVTELKKKYGIKDKETLDQVGAEPAKDPVERIKQLRSNPAELERQYDEMGRPDYVSADLIKELSPGWEDKAKRAEISDAVHTESSKAAAALFEHKLAKVPKESQVELLTGPVASGKTNYSDHDNSALTLEVNLSDPKIAHHYIDKILAHGAEPTITYVYVTPEQSAERRAIRFDREDGRPARIHTSTGQHLQLPATISKLAEEYGDKLKIRAIDNSGEKPVEMPTTSVAEKAYNGTKEGLLDEQQSHLDRLHAAAKISDRAYEANSRPEGRRVSKAGAVQPAASSAKSEGQRAEVARPADRQINYAEMQKRYPAQKAALTRAQKVADPQERKDAVIAAATKAVNEWEKIGAWPDHWSRWQRALDDAYYAVHDHAPPRLEDLVGESVAAPAPKAKEPKSDSRQDFIDTFKEHFKKVSGRAPSEMEVNTALARADGREEHNVSKILARDIANKMKAESDEYTEKFGRPKRPVDYTMEHLAAEDEKARQEVTPANPVHALIDAAYQKLSAGESLGNVTELNKLAEEHLGSSRVSGEWTPKDVFDAMEAGINKYLLDRGAELMGKSVPDALAELRGLLERVTSQGVRTDEQIKNQQFSTPPTISYVVSRLAAITPKDVVLEPSAGNGGLAVWAKAIGAEVHVNEIAERRQAMLEAIGFGKPSAHDGEILNSLLDLTVKPTVVVMNPPFSASAIKSHAAKNRNQYGFNHVDSALQRLEPGGRLVAILGGGRADDTNGGASLTTGPSGKWFEKVAAKYNVRANVRIHGREYQKYGIAFATRIIVIDKDGPTPSRTTRGAAKTWESVKQGNFDTLEEAYNAIQDVAESRPERSGSERAVSARGNEPATGVGRAARAGGAIDRTGVSAEPEVSRADEPAGGLGRPEGTAGGVRAGGSDQPVPLHQPELQSQEAVGEPAAEGAGSNHADLHSERPLSEPAQSGLDLERVEEANQLKEQEDTSAYATYRPTLKGPAHPGSIVETKTMATVPLPPITYKPSLPQALLEDGGLSAVQMEAVALAGQQNDIILPSGHRATALIGDGTGVGKGRISAAILLDNWNKGRKRLVWVSEKWDLMEDAKRDLNGIGATELAKKIKPLNKVNGTADIDHQGILFTTYALIRSVDKKGNKRSSQLEHWLRGQDEADGGYILFDECVPAGTLIETPSGPVAIELLKVGDTVLGVNHDTGLIEATPVVHAFRRSTSAPLFSVNGTPMTGNHPVWTENRGYVKAEEICAFDIVAHISLRLHKDAISNSLRLVQADVHREEEHHSQRSRDTQAAFLRQTVFGEVAHEQSETEAQAGDFGSGPREVAQRHAGLAAEAGRDRKAEQAPYGEQPFQRPCHSTEDIDYPEGANLRQFERRQRQIDACPRALAGDTLGLAYRGSYSGRSMEEVGRQPQVFQDRYSRANFEDRNRGGRLESQGCESEGSRREEGKVFSGARLATAALLEHSRTETLRGSDGRNNGSREVFNIETGTGNYFAGTLLVHNCHNLKNAVVSQGGQVSKIGQEVKALMERTPKLRSASLSATAATDVINLGYLDRLGLWGPGTPFPNGFAQFGAEIASGGMSAMEMIARELKAQGKYISRTLSFKGVTYSEIQHKITPAQKEVYRAATKAWRAVSDRAEDTIKNTTNGGGQAKGRFMSMFYSSQQRFFNVLLTTLKIPTAVAEAEKALAEGKSVVISLVNTNEAAQNREKNKQKLTEDSDEIPEYDFGPGEMLQDLVREHFPVQQYADDVDSNGKPVKVPVYVKDADGRDMPLLNPEAIQERENLLVELKQNLKMPANPLDILIEALGGPKKVAEMTGRKERYDHALGKFVSRGDKDIKRDAINLNENRLFQAGKKRVAVLSSAAGTGISLHAGNDVKNQQKRYHITLQVGWSADKAMQMLGRTNRTNQAHPPEYALLKSDLGGETRFISTIARRLGSLEALSKGQTKTNAGTDTMAKVNFETDQGRQATSAFYTQLMQNKSIPGTEVDGKPALTGMQILDDLKVLKEMAGQGKTVPPEDRTNVTKLLNRLLALDPDIQNAVYDYYYDIFQATVRDAIENGTLDTGVKTMPGDEFTVKEQRSIATDPKTGAQTFYYPTDAQVRTNRVSPKDLKKIMREREKAEPQILRNSKDGRLMLALKARDIVHANGSTQPAVHVITPGNGNWKKVAANSNYAWEPLGETVEAEREGIESALKDAEWQRDYAKKQAGSDPSDYDRGRLAQREQAVADLQAQLNETIDIEKDPAGYAAKHWEKEFNETPSHTTNEHHLIGGAVMRYWNPIREAAEGLSIYTTTDSKTGKRVVGIDIPAARIQNLLARITGGESTVNAAQITTDVMKNNMAYQLEGGIRVQRGRVAGRAVVEFKPANEGIGEELKKLGVVYSTLKVPAPGLPPVIMVNSAAKQIIDEMLGDKEWEGTALSPRMVAEIEHKIDGLIIRSAKQGTATGHLQNLLNQIAEARAEGNRGGVAFALEGWNEPNSHKSALEEAGHVVQRSIGGGSLAEHADVQGLAARPEALKALPQLKADGYDTSDPTLVTAELAMKIALADHLRLGLSDAEAAEWFYHYLKSIADRHGADAPERLRPVMQRVAEEALERFTNEGDDYGSTAEGNAALAPNQAALSQEPPDAGGLNARRQNPGGSEGEPREDDLATKGEQALAARAPKPLRITPELFERYIQPTLADPAQSFADWQKDYPGAEYMTIGRTGKMESVGRYDDLAPMFRKAQPAPAGGAPPSQPPTPPEDRQPFKFGDESIQEAFDAARGLKPESRIEKLKEFFEHAMAMATRKYVDLPNTPDYAALRFTLGQLEKQRAVASEKAATDLKRVLDRLDQTAYYNFNVKVVLDDLKESIEDGLEVPFYENHDLLNQDHQGITDHVASDPEVQKSLTERKKMWTKLINDYRAAADAIGFKTSKKFERESYFHHQVLLHAQEKTRSVSGSGAKLRTPTGRGFLKERQGSSLPINTDYIQSEYEVMAQMRLDTEIMRAIQQVDEKYNIAEDLKREAAQQNDTGIRELFDAMAEAEGGLKTGNDLYRETLNVKQAIGFNRLGEMAAKGELPRGKDGEWGWLVDELAENHLENRVQGQKRVPLPDAAHNALFRYMTYLLNKGDTGAREAGMIFKGIREKKAFIKDRLADKYVTWKDLIPDSHDLWQPREGSQMYFTQTLPEHLAQQLAENAGEKLGISADDLKQAMVRGQRFKEFVIPKEVASTLDNLRKTRDQGLLDRFHSSLVRPWKWWELNSPRRAVRFRLRHISGQTEATFIGNPHSFTKMAEAGSDLSRYFTKHEISPKLAHWLDRGGSGQLLQVVEMEDVNKLKHFEHLYQQEGKGKKIAKQLLGGYFKATKLSMNAAESMMRYMSYLDYLEQMQDNHGEPNNFGASDRDEIMALEDVRDRAFKLSNDLLGNYDDLTALGSEVKKILPFYSFREVNARRYYGFLRNAIRDAGQSNDYGSGAWNAGKRAARATPFVAYRIGKLLLKLSALAATITAYNYVFHRDEERELPPEVQGRPHIVFGRDKDGNVLYSSQIGILGDILEWVGLDKPQQQVKEVLDGRKSMGDLAKEMAEGPLNSVINQMSSFVKLPIELASGYSLYPKVTQPHPIRDRLDYIAQQLAVRPEYKAIAGQPQKGGYAGSLQQVFLNESEHEQSSYSRIHELKREFMEQHHKGDLGAAGYSEKANALYYWKQAMHDGDQKAEKRYLEEYFAAGGNVKGIKESLRTMNPLSGLNKQEKLEFVSGMDEADRKSLDQAFDFYGRYLDPGVEQQETATPAEP